MGGRIKVGVKKVSFIYWPFDFPLSLVFKMVSMTPQLFTVVELWAKMFQKCGKIRGSKKVAKNGQKWHVKIRKLKNLTFIQRMIITLLFSIFFAVNETIADKILIGQEKFLPPWGGKLKKKLTNFFLRRIFFEIMLQFSWNFQEMLSVLFSRCYVSTIIIWHDPGRRRAVLGQFSQNDPRIFPHNWYIFAHNSTTVNNWGGTDTILKTRDKGESNG